MRSDSKWMSATIVFLVLSLTVVQLEPAAFCQKLDDSVNAEGPAPEGVSQGTSPAVSADARGEIAQATPQSQIPAVAARTNSAAETPAPAAPKGRVWKWVLIVAAVGVGVAVAILAHNSKQDTPSIVVGPPSVGQPQ
jgi:hypothetical protein